MWRAHASIEYCPVTPEEFPVFAHAAMVAFGETMNEADLAAERLALEPDRTVAAFDGERIVGTTAASPRARSWSKT